MRQHLFVSTLSSVLFLSLVTCHLSLLFAEEAKEDELKVESKTVTGKISAVNQQGIAVEYSRSAKGSLELYLPLAEQVQLRNVQGVRELQMGDTVRVAYEQTYKEGLDGRRIVLKTVATEIAFLKRAPVFVSTEADEDDDDGS